VGRLRGRVVRAALYLRFLPTWVRNHWRSTESIFSEIYVAGRWGDAETRSGSGSKVDATVAIRTELPRILERYGIRTLVDVPCGDLNWLRRVPLDLDRYVGADIVAAVIEANRARFGAEGRSFLHLDLCRDPLPLADAVLCRDGLVHLSNRLAVDALANVRRSGARYLLATTFDGLRENRDVVTGFWRPTDLRLPPFDLLAPVEEVVEAHVPGTSLVKKLAVWSLG